MHNSQISKSVLTVAAYCSLVAIYGQLPAPSQSPAAAAALAIAGVGVLVQAFRWLLA